MGVLEVAKTIVSQIPGYNSREPVCSQLAFQVGCFRRWKSGVSTVRFGFFGRLNSCTFFITVVPVLVVFVYISKVGRICLSGTFLGVRFPFHVRIEDLVR